MLGVAAWLVPGHEREDWRAEWISELWYVIDAHRSSTRFCMGAFRDASWLRIDDLRLKRGLFVSPVCILALLMLLTASCVLLAFRLPQVPGVVRQQPVLAHALDALFAFLILASTTHPDGNYPEAEGGHLTGRAGRIQWWAFLAAKLALLVPAVFFGTLDLIPLIAPAGAQPLAAMIGYILAFRWALGDQCRRCPVCLRLLGNPVRIGQRSHILLEWYGVELVCTRGHGLMHVDGAPTISFRSQQWLALDASWRGLFSKVE
jgi:hypothetical protein